MKKTYLYSFCARCLTLLVLALLSTNLAWGETATLSISASFTKDGSLNDTQGNSWDIASDGTYTASTSFIQVGTNKANVTYLKLESSGFATKKITKVQVWGTSKASTNVTPKIYIGENQIGEGSAYTTQNASSGGSEFSASNTKNYTGEIKVLISRATAATGAIYFNKLIVTYEDATTPTGPSLSVSPTAIDFGTVYQNATVDAKEVTVSFANLTTNDVAAAISGSVFGIDKTGSFTSGDKITITPNTATLGEYSETLTVSATGVDNQEVTVKMNVVKAPTLETYNKVTSVDDLAEGDIIVLASSTTAYGVAPGENKFITAQAFEGSSASLTNNVLKAADAYELTLAKSGDNWTMTGADGIVGTTEVKKMSFGNSSATTTWTISITEGNAFITSTTASYGTIKYNSTSPRFVNYASGQTDIQIYKKELPPHTEAYTVTFNAGDNGSCATSSLTEDKPDAGVTLPNCTPNDGYQFVGWSTNESGTSANAGVAGATYYPQGNCTLYACYAQVYKVTIEEPSNGSLVVKVGDATVTSGEYFIAGTVLNIEATPADGYKFRNIQVEDNSTHTFTKDNPKTYNLLACNTTIKAKFDKKSQYTIDYMVNGVSTGKQVDLYEDKNLVFPKVENVGDYVFGGWKKGEGIDGTAASFADCAATENVMPTENTTYYAVFYKTSEKSVTFDPKNAPTPSSTRTWTIDNVKLYISDGQHYTSGSPKTFTVNSGTSKYFEVSTTNNEYIKSLDVTISETKYKINSVETSAELSTNGTTQTVTAKTNNVNDIKCYATSGNQIRVTNLVANVFSSSDFCTFIPAEVTISAAKYATLGLPYAVTIPENVSAYTASVSGNTVTLSKINKSEGGSNVIPAECGVILYANVNEPTTFTFYGTTTEGSYPDNKLVAVTGDDYTCTSDDEGLVYYLGKDTDGSAIFKKLNLGGTIAAGKAYLKLNDEADAKLEVTFGDEVTGIESLQPSTLNPQPSQYNLNGMKVNEAYKGIVIMNGKKYINK